ncbi:MAG: hypothetical protein GW795_05600 [Cyanobacteria bacterium]|nr:hypothetical protein [Cyanobacteria bacterium CG_2015-16_32_12]NCO78811.1 hypothetical protein [Cyanobacteria bacterium CG_2015-22_32_23]NCQ05192.1 hypothetical protein [Cyanobacteria bacterium CG_2015-09_32_10]NCQ41363.1 hypothetical protein [Cyanobacteria bacterium CG_2015-04_32_10]NCS85900.1 hypothetical protein [Cyanobacteria bacterium CG_2015-02_32_10]
MLRRRRNLPWIQRNSRFIIGAIAIVGLILTIYLTILKLSGGEVACTANGSGGCNSVLDSAYAYPLDPQGKTGIPLTVFGSLAYFTMAILALAPLFINPEKNKELRQKLEKSSWWLMLLVTFAMAAFSSYLMYVLAFKLQAVCPYCISSALFSFTLLTLTIIGHDWKDMGQIFFTGITVALITLVSAVGVYANVNTTAVDPNMELAAGGKTPITQAQTAPKPPLGWEITTTSGESEIALAKHLASKGAIMYSAYWCPHCYEQKQLFGKEAFKEVGKVECDPKGVSPAPQKCVDAKIRAFPTWIIDGKIYEGVQDLEKLAKLTGYKGSTNFKYTMR